jgi:hypothetical protein
VGEDTRLQRKKQEQVSEPWRTWGDTSRYVIIRLALVVVPLIIVWLLYVVI